ncbi:hypothetical protein JCM10213_006852 [Rhodosporidiobolus nylandii]
MTTLGKRSSSPGPAPPSSTPAKRQKTSLSDVLTLDSVDLQITPHDELVAHVQTLQAAYKGLEKQLKEEKAKKAPIAPVFGGSTAGNTDGPENWSEEKIQQKAAQVASVAHKAIKSAMKWQPSCKQGSTKWSYTGVVPCHAVFYKLFDFPIPTKKKDMFKVKKLTREQFDKAIDSPRASIRYGSLSITGPTVTLKWAADDNSFTLTGTYGLGY